MTTSGAADRFSLVFDRAVAACARAQQLASDSTGAAARARATRASARRTRTLAAETRAAWASADEAFCVMRHEVEEVAIAMRDAGMSRRETSAAVRAHVRFLLYDGGLVEEVAEPLVQRASLWVDMLFAA